LNGIKVNYIYYKILGIGDFHHFLKKISYFSIFGSQKRIISGISGISFPNQAVIK